MFLRRSRIRVAFLAILFAGSMIPCGSALRADDDPAQALILRLSPTHGGGMPDRAAEDALVALGSEALPALEKALHLGLRGPAYRAFRSSRQSRRAAVVRVLARIPDMQSTDLLVRVLADPADNYAMRDATLRALEQRTLTTKQLCALLMNPEPKPVLLALNKIGTVTAEHPLRAEVERIHDSEEAARQLRNENGYPNALPRDLWEVRLQSGRVLGNDMLSETRERARGLVAELRAAVRQRPSADEPKVRRPVESWEGRIAMALFDLHALGSPVQASVREAAVPAEGDAAVVLDMARLMVGDESRLMPVMATLTDSNDASLRHCAVIALVRIADQRSKPALWEALRDPLVRKQEVCVPVPEESLRYHPIRERAARALIAMGEDPEEVNRRAGE